VIQRPIINTLLATNDTAVFHKHDTALIFENSVFFHKVDVFLANDRNMIPALSGILAAAN
jgi:hypothetical protein